MPGVSGATRAVGFNSRTREGCDSSPIVTILALVCFNSRTREGCDIFARIPAITRRGFKFTPPGGVRRPRGAEEGRYPRVSIHAPGRGATSPEMHIEEHLGCFNSRTREGCDIR